MLKWIVAALGAILVVVGLVAAVQGWSIVQVERGWTQVIAGTTMLTGGCLILAIAAAIARLDALIDGLEVGPARAAPEDIREVKPTARNIAPEQAESEPVREEVAPLAIEAMEPVPPAPLQVEMPIVQTAPAQVEPEPEPAARKPFSFSVPRPRRPSAPIRFSPPDPIIIPSDPIPFPVPPRRSLSKVRWPEPEIVESSDLRAKLDEAVAAANAGEESASPMAPDKPPAMVRRYESGGVAYQLFADGSIEAQTESGQFHFASLAELRTFIESKK